MVPKLSPDLACLPNVNSRDCKSPFHSDGLNRAIDRFTCWLGSNGPDSFDPYDIWGTPFALKARSRYYKKNPIGFASIAPILALEIIAPSTRTLFARKARFATADAQLILAFLNLYSVTGEAVYLAKARALGEDLLGYSIPGYSGHCWGYPFDWQNQRDLWRKNTPFITCTPYCFEGFLALNDVTREERYLEIAASIAKFVHRDLKEVSTGPDAAAGSYSPIDESQVVNAGAYRAMVLFEAAARFDEPDYAESARRNLNYILQSQRDNGSWFYATDKHGQWIDHFHTCFVLKNLHKLNRRLADPKVTESIRRGWKYYRENLFDADGNPKMYAIQPRTQIVKLEMYNFAEAITLGSLLREEIEGALDLAKDLAQRLVSYQLPDGHFVTRTYVGGIRHTFPYLRWPQAQIFFALTNLLVARKSNEKPSEASPATVSNPTRV
jgi:hypothetical protein